MRVGSSVLFVAGMAALVSLSCGFASNPSQKLETDVIVTAAPLYEPTAALSGGERFPQGARLLRIHDGKADGLIPEFAASADANVSFDGKSLLFAGKKTAGDKWQIWEMTLADRALRRVVTSDDDAIRPLYLPGSRVVFAQKTAGRFELESARLLDSKTLTESEGPSARATFPLTYIHASAIPADVLADGRVLFESGFPLGEGATPELFLVYSDGSGVESYRCDHPANAAGARWGGRQLRSGKVVFTRGGALARFTSARSHEERVAAPRAEYAGSIAETASGDWLVSARASADAKYALKVWKPGAALMRTEFAANGQNLVEPVLVAAHDRPRRHPSALHDWDYANLLALDARVSRDGVLDGVPAKVRIEMQGADGRALAMGSAPVEADGSFFVKAPADRAIRFVLLAAEGTVLRQEHGWFWIRKGEQRYCVGCHAGPEHAPENAVPQVLLRTQTPVDLTGTAQPLEKGGN